MNAQKLERQYVYLLIGVISLVLVKCEDGRVFKIRKCCAENELILEKTSECVEFRLLKMDSHIYYHENETEANSTSTTSGES